ncbi:MAG: hypothetical protein GY758_17600, partial [Fuerstiella sp.]|nr:hypothetical protein [Fuerstiella sp.]
SGHVRIYHWTGSVWTQLGVDIDGEAADDESGHSVSMSADGQIVAIGAMGAYPYYVNGSDYSGYVRTYQLLPTIDSLSTVTDTISITVDPQNDIPTLNALTDVTILEDVSEQSVALAGITAGPNESQPLRVTATSSDTGLIPSPTVAYASAAATGSLLFTPIADAYGTSTITVTVEDGGRDGILDTAGDNATYSQTLEVDVTPVNDIPTLDAIADVNITEDAPEQTMNLTGITAGGGETQLLSITAVSDNAGLIPDPTVYFDGQSSTGTLKFTPVADQSGTATITVTVADGGLDNDLGTPADNGVINRTVIVKAEI